MTRGSAGVSRGLRHDARRRVALPPQGQSKHREARALWQAAQDEFLAVYGKDQSESLRAALLDVAYDPRFGPGNRKAAP